jgi:hypothetical protein
MSSPGREHNSTPDKEIHNKNKPYFVFDNICDALNEVNIGNGLAVYLYHREDKQNGINYDVKKFVKIANIRLKVETSLEEIHLLLQYHHPYSRASDSTRKLIFEIDEEGNILQEDPTLKRIMEIRNAYIDEINSKLRENPQEYPQFTTPLRRLTKAECATNCAPQIALLSLNPSEEFHVNEVLNTPITLIDDPEPHNTSIVSNGLLLTFFSMVEMANNLLENEPHFLNSSILAKYFNAGEPDKYPQGNDSKYYLAGIPRFTIPEVNDVQPDLDNPDYNSYAEKIAERLSPYFPNSTPEKMRELVQRYISMHLERGEMRPPFMTAFENLENIKNVDPYLRSAVSGFESVSGREILRKKSVIDLGKMYKIQRDMLSEETLNLLDPTTMEGKKLQDKFRVTYTYFAEINSVMKSCVMAMRKNMVEKRMELSPTRMRTLIPNVIGNLENSSPWQGGAFANKGEVSGNYNKNPFKRSMSPERSFLPLDEVVNLPNTLLRPEKVFLPSTQREFLPSDNTHVWGPTSTIKEIPTSFRTIPVNKFLPPNTQIREPQRDFSFPNRNMLPVKETSFPIKTIAVKDTPLKVVTLSCDDFNYICEYVKIVSLKPAARNITHNPNSLLDLIEIDLANRRGNYS